jgi:teneurin-4
MKKKLSNEEKKKLAYERQNAVRKAWKQEKERVSKGYGTRRWTIDEQKEILQRGAVSGYQGHHMKSVSLYPEHAGNSENIQFLNQKEHLYGAHGGSYHNLTDGYYDPETRTMKKFGNKIEKLPKHELVQSENRIMENARMNYENVVSQSFKSNNIDLDAVRKNYEKQYANSNSKIKEPTEESSHSQNNENKYKNGYSR